MVPATELVISANDSALEALLTSGEALAILLWNGEGLRSDARTEFDKAAQENSGRIRFVKVDVRQAPNAAERFEVDKSPVLVTWANGDVLARRNKPWGTDVKGLVEDLLKIAPAAPVPVVLKTANKPIKVTDETFQAEVIDNDLPVVVDFWAEWCGPCKRVAPILDKLAGEYSGKLIIAKVNTDENPGLSQYFKIESIPTLMFIKNQKIVGQTAGAYPEDALRKMFDQLVALAA